MVVVTDFDLRATIRQVLADGVGPAPKEVALKVLELVPIGMERDLLGMLLPEFCADEIRKQRFHRHHEVGRYSATGARGTKWTAVREAMLEEPYEVKGEWKHFGDLNTDDVSWLIDDRTKASEALVAEARRFSNLLIFMRQEKVKTVRRLPHELLEKVMS